MVWSEKKRFNIGIVILFISYILLRLFSSGDSIWIRGDEAKYLTAANNFPFHTVYNHSFFAAHPLFHPYMIHFFQTIISPDYIAGFAVSFFSILLLFVSVLKLLSFLKIKRDLIFVSLACLTFAPFLVSYSRSIMREPLFLFLAYSTIYLFLKAIKSDDTKYYAGAILFGGLTGLTDSRLVFLVLILAAGALIFGNKNRFKASMVIASILLIFFLGSVFPRLYIYSTNTYYPVTPEGCIDKVSDFNLDSLLATAYFPCEIKAHYPTFTGWRIDPYVMKENVIGLLDIIGVSKAFKGLGISTDYFFILVFTIIIVPNLLPLLLRFYRFLCSSEKKTASLFLKKSKELKDNPDLFILIITLVGLIPMFRQPSNPRFSIMALVGLWYFFSRGLLKTLSFLNLRQHISKNLHLFAVIILIVSVVYLQVANAHTLIFNYEKKPGLERVAAYLDSLPKDGVMVELGSVPEITYLSKKRVVMLPVTSEELKMFGKLFQLNYAVIGRYDDYWFGGFESISYIQQHPESYKLLKVIRVQHGEVYKVYESTAESE